MRKYEFINIFCYIFMTFAVELVTMYKILLSTVRNVIYIYIYIYIYIVYQALCIKRNIYYYSYNITTKVTCMKQTEAMSMRCTLIQLNYPG